MQCQVAINKPQVLIFFSLFIKIDELTNFAFRLNLSIDLF